MKRANRAAAALDTRVGFPHVLAQVAGEGVIGRVQSHSPGVVVDRNVYRSGQCRLHRVTGTASTGEQVNGDLVSAQP